MKQLLKISDLLFNNGQIDGLPKNPRFIKDDKFKKLVKSIEENPEMLELRELLVYPYNDKYVVIGGNMRLRALKELGYKEVPCKVIPETASVEQLKAYTIKDNNGFGEWDFDLLSNEWDFADLEDWGVDLPNMDLESDEKEIVEDEAPEVYEESEPITKLGDIWQLGRHRLMCGDSTSVTDVEKLMNGNKADMVFTDPPYGVSYTGGMKIENGKIESNGKKQIKNDALDYENLYRFLYDVFINLKNNTLQKSAFYVFYAHNRSREFLNAFYDAGLKQRSIIIWHKTSGGFGDFMAQYMNAYEPCIYGSNGDSVNWYGATNEKTVWDMDKEKKCDLHPTMKPIEVVARAINNSSKKEDTVLDLFGGSGSTLIACEQLDRTCYMMELDPHYVDVIIARWEKFTGQKAVLLN